MNTETIKPIFAILALIAVPLGGVAVVNNFIETNNYINEETVKLELFNAVMPYTFMDNSTWKGGIPADFSKTKNNVNITVVETDGKDFVAVAYNVRDVNTQFCYSSAKIEITECNLAPIA